MLKIYNTIKHRIEPFRPLGKTVGIYTCGPTVYSNAHIGNLRSYLFADIVKRTLQYSGYSVRHVMNITDVDDKTIRGSQEKNLSLESFTSNYTKTFFEDITRLHILRADLYPRATKHVGEMIDLIEKLLKKKLAYTSTDGSVYFDISKFRKYGKLSQIKKRTLKIGARVSQDEYTKDQACDFVLWKAWTKEDGDVFWQSPFGRGRPGWHIECSAMSTKYLGQPFDIHTGGVDNIFPHHENEIAQSEGSSPKPFVKYWIHGEHLLVDKKKMSKSLKNDYRLFHLEERRADPLAFRYLCLTAHYRTRMNFTWKSLKGAQDALDHLRRFAEEVGLEHGGPLSPNEQKLSQRFQSAFVKALHNDLNTAEALSVVWQIIHASRKNQLSPREALRLLLDFDRVLGLDLSEYIKKEKLSPEVETLISERERARREKNFNKADTLRVRLLKEFSVEIEDTPEGPKARKK